ncbi:hypothetical protein V493_00217 [Pseudogymnoascus sp. VKM F-4281 (FW-2241)]|nr:hypothetical protein V493_00217 [Pseudogymnoascus sp. VKM F-4281 (FW-2241)]
MENLVIGTGTVVPCPKQGMDHVRKVLSVYRWHNERLPNGRLKTVVNSLRQLIREAERHYEGTHSGQSPYALEHFDAWSQTTLEMITDRVKTWGAEWLDHLNIPAINNNGADNAIRRNLVYAYSILPDIDITGFYPNLP